MKYLTKKLFEFLINKFKKNFLISITLSILSSGLQITGFGIVFIYLNLISGNVENNLSLNLLGNIGLNRFNSLYENFLLITLVIGLAFAFSSIARIFSQLYILNFSENISNYCFQKFISNFIKSPLEYKINLPRSQFTVQSRLYIDRFKESCLSILNLIQNFSLIGATLLFVILIDYKIIFIVVILILILSIYLFLTKKKIKNLSNLQIKTTSYISKILIKFGFAYKDLEILNLNFEMFENLKKQLQKRKKIIVLQNLIINLPKYIIEISLVILLLSVLVFLNNNNETFISNLPSLVVLFLLSIRLIPTFSAIVRDYLILKKNKDTVSLILKNKFKLLIFNKKNINLKINNKQHWKFKKAIKVINAKFSFENKKNFSYNFSILKKKWVLVKGISGSGKTTLFNLMCGFLDCQSGKIIYDNINIKKNKKLLLNHIGYVSQSGMLFEGTLGENICFKNNLLLSDKRKLKKIYRICELNNIVTFNKLFTKIINFNAPNISGGQKQRMLIARMLFQNPQIIIMDESMNALDNNSEVRILKKIKKYTDLTLIYASHHNTKFKFDKIINIYN